MTPAQKFQSTPQNPHDVGDVDENSMPTIGRARGNGPISHKALIDHNETVFGCIDHWQNDVELIRLDGGHHWSTVGALGHSFEPDTARDDSVEVLPEVFSKAG